MLAIKIGVNNWLNRANRNAPLGAFFIIRYALQNGGGKPVNRFKQVSMLGAALLLGVLVSVQWPTIAAQVPNSPDQVSRTIQQLELE